MNLTTRFHRSILRALTPDGPRNRDLPAKAESLRVAGARPLHDPDWAIREIVEELMFEPAR